MQRFTPLLADAARFARCAPGDRWFVDETYVKVAGAYSGHGWVYNPDQENWQKHRHGPTDPQELERQVADRAPCGSGSRPPPPTSTSTTFVPLAEAWRSGATTWTTSRRQSFANDLTRPQLIAVTDNVNQSKGDQDPSTWQPSRTAYRCTYAKMWIAVKSYCGLKAQTAEKTALQTMLNTCTS